MYRRSRRSPGRLTVRCVPCGLAQKHRQHGGGLGPSAFPVGDLSPTISRRRRGNSAMSATTGFEGRRRTPPARCSGSGVERWGFEGGRSSLARPQCSTLRGLALPH